MSYRREQAERCIKCGKRLTPCGDFSFEVGAPYDEKPEVGVCLDCYREYERLNKPAIEFTAEGWRLTRDVKAGELIWFNTTTNEEFWKKKVAKEAKLGAERILEDRPPESFREKLEKWIAGKAGWLMGMPDTQKPSALQVLDSLQHWIDANPDPSLVEFKKELKLKLRSLWGHYDMCDYELTKKAILDWIDEN
jgi:hypothetical protein